MAVLNAFDSYFFYLINKNCSNKFFDILMPLLSQLGTWEILFVFVFIFVIFKKKEARRLGVLLLAGLFVSCLSVSILKIWIARPRPFLVLPNVNLLVQAKGFSFPSGHAVNTFVVATLLFIFSKKFYYIYIVACSVALSRIYLGVHFPSDVMAGALIGVALGYLIMRIAELFLSCSQGKKAV
ncbi:MAG: phosphatase PAP2 family protein [Candidatus Omnitrophota bacterium]|jgi:undecaprenyl-diphosphatase